MERRVIKANHLTLVANLFTGEWPRNKNELLADQICLFSRLMKVKEGVEQDGLTAQPPESH